LPHPDDDQMDHSLRLHRQHTAAVNGQQEVAR
jgi:hypothetical protein